MRHTLREMPFIRLLPPFMAGIVIAIFNDIPANVLFILFPAVILCYALWISVSAFQRSYRYRWVSGLWINLAMLSAGMLIVNVKTDRYYPRYFGAMVDSYKPVDCLVRIAEPPLQKTKTLKTTVNLLRMDTGGGWMAVSGKALVYFRKDSMAARLRYGDVLHARIRFKKIPPPVNPHEFDYSQYMRFHNIEYQAYLQADDWAFTGINDGMGILRAVYRLRDYFYQILTWHIHDPKALQVASALLLGYREYLDDQTRKAYASAGAMHVLAVSGLHVGIIFFVFQWLFRPMERWRYGRAVRAVILILLIWLYAALTGLSPSVLRASTMFSFIVIGKSLDRYVNIYNVIAASAFFLLVADPYLLMEVGFQLSYLALTGIIFLQPRIYGLLYVANPLLDKVWALTAVSFAAQIATFPLGLLYFHQFPVLFPVSNLIVIPAATLILYNGLALFLAEVIWHPLSILPGEVLQWLLKALNASIFTLENIPYSLIQGIWITTFETWLIYGIILSFVYWWINRHPALLQLLLFTAVIFTISRCIFQLQNHLQRTITVYHVPGDRAVEFRCGKTAYFMADDALVQNDDRMLFHIKHNWWANGIKHPVLVNPQRNSFAGGLLYKNGDFIQFLNSRIAIPGQLPAKPPVKPVKVDYVILGQDFDADIERFSQFFNVQKVILDATVEPQRAVKWASSWRERGMEVYAVRSDGAVVIHL